MTDGLRALADVLERERAAVVGARVDELLALQEDKQGLIATLHANAPSEDALAPLLVKARGNVVLLRHLVACLRGVLAPESEPSYTANGPVEVAPPSRRRGAL